MYLLVLLYLVYHKVDLSLLLNKARISALQGQESHDYSHSCYKVFNSKCNDNFKDNATNELN